MKMLLSLCTGFVLWLIYGFLRSDMLIVAANAISLGLCGVLLGFKFHHMSNANRGRQNPGIDGNVVYLGLSKTR